MSNPLGLVAKLVLGRVVRDQRRAQRLAIHAMSTPHALERVAARGLQVRSVIDVGASDGRWSVATAERWPQARYHLVEANDFHQPALRRLCAERSNFGYTLAAAGVADGEVAFDTSDPFGGRAAPADGSEHPTVGQRSLTSIAREHDLQPPYLIKLDTHGIEVPILDGAADLFGRTSLFVIEAYNFRIRPDSLHFSELCGYMRERGFAVIDISEPMWRARDAALWQLDLFFVAADRPEFDHVQFG